MMNPLTKSEPENIEMVKKKEMKPKEKCPLADDLYDENGDMEC